MEKVIVKKKVTEPQVVWDNFNKLTKAVNELIDAPSPGAPTLVDISLTSTVAGWSSTTTKKIFYQVNGKVVDIFFFIAGVSNSSAASFTLPGLTAHTDLAEQWAIIRGLNNSLTFTGGSLKIEANSNLVNLYRAASEANWTSSNNKTCIGMAKFLIN